MKQVTFFALTAPMVQGSGVATDKCQQKTGKLCLPGLDTMGSGVNVVTGETTSLRPMAFTYDQGNSWINPFNSQEQKSYPDQMNVKNAPSTLGSISSRTYFSERDYANSLAIDAGLDASVGLFSASVDVKYAESFMSKRSEYLGFTVAERMATIYQADLKPPFLLPLDPDFKQATKYYFGGQYDAKKFAEFVEYYGTHYVTRAAFGGKGEMKTAVSKSFAEAHQTNDLNIQASAHFSFLAAKLDVNHHSDQASTAWTSTSTVTSQLYGGTIGGSLDNWEKWYPTFWKNPVKITYKLTSYSEIIKDQQEITNFLKGYEAYLRAHPYSPPPACAAAGEKFCQNKCCELGETCAGWSACCGIGMSSHCEHDSTHVQCCPDGNACCKLGCCPGGMRCGDIFDSGRQQHCVRMSESGDIIESMLAEVSNGTIMAAFESEADKVLV